MTAQSLEVRAPRDEHHIVARIGEAPADDPADRAGAVDDESHDQ